MFLKSNFSFCQEFCSRADSIVVMYIPWDIITFMTVEEDGIRILSNKNEIHFTDKNIISENLNCFSNIYSNYEIELDCRMIIDIYLQTGRVTVLVDSFGCFTINGKYYSRDYKLVEWISKYVTPMKYR